MRKKLVFKFSVVALIVVMAFWLLPANMLFADDTGSKSASVVSVPSGSMYWITPENSKV